MRHKAGLLYNLLHVAAKTKSLKCNCGVRTWEPVLPSRLQTYRPRKPLLPSTVATMPLKLERPPVPRFMEAIRGVSTALVPYDLRPALVVTTLAAPNTGTAWCPVSTVHM